MHDVRGHSRGLAANLLTVLVVALAVSFARAEKAHPNDVTLVTAIVAFSVIATIALALFWYSRNPDQEISPRNPSAFTPCARAIQFSPSDGRHP